MGNDVNRILMGLAGIAAILAIAFLLSSNRRAIRLRVVGAAFALQAGDRRARPLHEPGAGPAIEALSRGVANLLGYAGKGTEFLFGPPRDRPARPDLRDRRLPVIIFFAALVAILYYLGIMQRIVRWVGGAIGWVTGISRVESLGAAANIFVGQSESPLVVRPYLAALPPAQLFTVMTVGMAGVAGTILAAYASLLGDAYLPYLLAAAFMSAPGGILMAKIIMPDEPPRRTSCRSRAARAGRATTGRRRRDLRGRRAAGQHHHGRRPGRADRRQARRRGRRDGARLRRAGRARQRPARRDRRLVRLSRSSASSASSATIFQPDHVPDRRALERGRDGRRAVRHQDRAQRVRRLHRSRRDAAGRAQRRAAAPSSPSRCAASPISARSRSRWR